MVEEWKQNKNLTQRVNDNQANLKNDVGVEMENTTQRISDEDSQDNLRNDGEVEMKKENITQRVNNEECNLRNDKELETQNMKISQKLNNEKSEGDLTADKRVEKMDENIPQMINEGDQEVDASHGMKLTGRQERMRRRLQLLRQRKKKRKIEGSRGNVRNDEGMETENVNIPQRLNNEAIEGDVTDDRAVEKVNKNIEGNVIEIKRTFYQENNRRRQKKKKRRIEDRRGNLKIDEVVGAENMNVSLRVDNEESKGGLTEERIVENVNKSIPQIINEEDHGNVVGKKLTGRQARNRRRRKLLRQKKKEQQIEGSRGNLRNCGGVGAENVSQSFNNEGSAGALSVKVEKKVNENIGQILNDVGLGDVKRTGRQERKRRRVQLLRQRKKKRRTEGSQSNLRDGEELQTENANILQTINEGSEGDLRDDKSCEVSG